jgi:hypothetical protein
VEALRRFRAETSPLVLVGVWALLQTLAMVATMSLPGSPTYAEDGSGSLAGAVAFSLFFGLFLFLGVRLAWWFVIFLDASAVLFSVAAFAVDPHPKPLLVGAFYAFALWLIWSGSVEGYVRGGRRLRAARLH